MGAVKQINTGESAMTTAKIICASSFSGASRVDDAQHVLDVAIALEEARDEGVKAERERCLRIIADQEVVFLSSEYATDQPLSSFGERFACSQIAAAIKDGHQ